MDIKIILDANAIIYIAKYKINFLEYLDELLQKPYRLFTTQSVLNELKKISQKKSKNAAYAKIALKLIEKHKIEILNYESKSADDDIVKIANKDWMVLTNDKKLKEILKNLGTKVISVRQKAKFEK